MTKLDLIKRNLFASQSSQNCFDEDTHVNGTPINVGGDEDDDDDYTDDDSDADDEDSDVDDDEDSDEDEDTDFGDDESDE